MTPGPEMGPCRLRVELAQQCTNPVQLEIGRSVALGISTPCREVSILVIIRVRSRVVGLVYM